MEGWQWVTSRENQKRVFLAASKGKNPPIFMTMSNNSMIFQWFYFKLGPRIKLLGNSMTSRIPWWLWTLSYNSQDNLCPKFSPQLFQLPFLENDTVFQLFQPMFQKTRFFQLFQLAWTHCIISPLMQLKKIE